MTNNITNKLAEVINNIENLCQKHHRSPKDVHLLAVSKTKPASDIRSAFNAGQRCFGENYLQEAIGKMQELNDLSIEWHFIGSIQSNKTKDLATHFDWIHSVDRLKIAKRLSEQRPATAAALNICLQINISNESSKSGFHLDEIDSIVDEVMMLPNIP